MTKKEKGSKGKSIIKNPDDTLDPVDPDASDFRKSLQSRAEERLFSLIAPELEALGPEETKQLVHELRVHQIELEIQNEELRRAQDEISVAQARYFDLYDMAPVGYCTLNEKGLILESNLTAAVLLGVAREALIKRPLSQFIFNEDQAIYYLHHHRLVETGMPQAFELRLVKNDETVFWARLNTTTLHDVTNTPVFRVVLSDITEHRMAVEALQQSELRESENRFQKLFEQHSAVKLILNARTGSIIDANEAAVKFYGWPLEKLKQMNLREINTLPPEGVRARLKKAALSGNAGFEFRHRRADGSIRDVEVFSNKIESAGSDYLYSIIHDITERKCAEEEREAMIEFLHFINNSQETEVLIHAATAYFRKHSGCEAVGIRLKEGDDYPYYETRGFPEEFVQAENRLCTCDETGHPLRDSDGKPVLKCMCGNVLNSRVDPSKPFFSTKGSFWSNCTTELLSSTSEADRQAGTLDRCIGEGYESIALIPLQVGAVRLGLLQLNDRNKGRFTLETITLWERLAGYLAVALAKFRADEALRRAKEEWERTFESVPDLIAILDNRHRVLRVNKAMARRLGVQPADCVGLHCYETVHGTSCPPALCPHSRTIMDGCEHSQELHEDRLGGDFLVTTTPLLNEKGARVGSVHVAHDITERKQAETALRQSEERYHSLFNLMLEGFCIIEVQFDADNRPVDYRFLEINPAFEKQTGLHNVQGKLIRELIPENEAYWFEIYGKVALTGESRRFVNEAKALNRWYDVSAYRIEGPDSRKVAILFNDITESRHAHAALKKLNEELEKRVFERTQDLAVFIEKLQLEIADREKAEASVLRLNRLYAVLSEINHALVRTNNRDSIFNEFCRIAVKNGSFKLAWVGLVDEKSGELKSVASAGATGYLKDIKITANEEPAGRGPTGISIREGTSFICNDFLGSAITRPWHERGRAHGIRASASIALKQEGQVIGALTLYADQKDFFDQQHVALLQQIGADISFALDFMVRETKRQKAEQALEEETVERRRAEAEVRTLNAELEERVVRRTSQLVAAHKEVQETNEKLRLEISGRKKIEKELLQSKKQLQAINNQLEERVEQRTLELQETQQQYLHAEKLSVIGKLSASIAHEFNNPLQGIMSILKGVKKRAILEEEDRELLDAAIDESERMKNLIRSLQDFNRPSSGKKVVMDVHKSMDSLLLLCKKDFNNRRISVALHYAEQLSLIVAVPDQIKQVFLNLLTNAADACVQPGGVITISTWQDDKRVAVAIKDTGVGIDPEKMDMIFQPFYTTKPAVRGTGLGLSICHGIVQHHHGEIRVESQPGEGATFTVLLPITGE